MKIKIEGYIARYQPSWKSEPGWWFTTSGESSVDTVIVCPHTIECEVPEGDMIPERVAAIREQKKRVRVLAAEKIIELDEAEQKLLCLPNEVASGAARHSQQNSTAPAWPRPSPARGSPTPRS